MKNQTIPPELMADIEAMLNGYLEAAQWADAPENSRARFTAKAIGDALIDCMEFIEACGPLFGEALARDGYSAERFGHDFWLTRAGHGAGFWDRSELSEPPSETVQAIDRDGKPYPAGERGESLGDHLSAIAYGGAHISRFAYADVYASRGWLYFS